VLKKLLTYGTTGANITTVAAAHTLDAMCFLLGEFSTLTAQTKLSFPVVVTPFNDGPVTRDSPDGLAVQGELESGTVVTFHMFSATHATKASFAWTITGEKGALRFEGNFVNMQMEPPKLYWQKGSEQGFGANMKEASVLDFIMSNSKSTGEVWELVEVENPMAYGQIGELYEAFAKGEKIKGSLVDFEGAALRHRMLEACFKSSRDGTRETYRK
jgi:predicted dehydrogenase